MREMKFKVKRDKRYCKTQDWTYGVPFIDFEGDCIFKTDCSEWVVIPETVGQFAGLYDKNGNEIYEGDLVRASFNYEPKSFIEKTEEFEDVLCEVYFMYGCFKLRLVNSQISVNLENAWNIEVVGNIHDTKILKEINNENSSM